MGTEILAIIAGIILRNNPQWFHGAHTVGNILFIYGIIVAVIEIVAVLFFLIVAASRR